MMSVRLKWQNYEVALVDIYLGTVVIASKEMIFSMFWGIWIVKGSDSLFSIIFQPV